MRGEHRAVWLSITKRNALAKEVVLWYAQRRSKDNSLLGWRVHPSRKSAALMHVGNGEHNGGWYDDEAELHFYFSWTGLCPFSKALARENLEVREVQQRRRRFKKVEEIGRQQQEHDELLRGAMKKLGGGAVA